MGWRMRLVACGVRATPRRSLDRLASLAIRVAGAVVAAVVLATLVVYVAWPLVYRGHMRRWHKTLGDSSIVAATLTPRDTNASALALEHVTAAFGLDLVEGIGPAPVDPGGVERADDPDLKGWCNSIRLATTSRDIALPETVRDILEERSVEVDAILEVFQRPTHPRWEMVIGESRSARVPRPTAVAALVRWLLASATAAEDDGDAAAVDGGLIAAWSLAVDLQQRPEPEVRHVAAELASLVMAAVRRDPGISDGWPERLAASDPLTMFRSWVRVDGRLVVARRGAVAEQLAGGEWLRPPHWVIRPVERWLLLAGSAALRTGLDRLSEVPVEQFQPDVYFAGLHEGILRWNTVARRALPQPWPEWPMSVRRALEADLTAAVVRLRMTPPDGWSELLAQLPTTVPSSRTDGVWEQSREDGCVRIRLVRPRPWWEAGPDTAPNPLEFCVPIPEGVDG